MIKYRYIFRNEQMSDPKETLSKKPRAFLLAAIFPHSFKEITPLKELTRLAETAEIDVLGGIIQRKTKPESATFFGKGKIKEIQEKIEELKPNLIICDNDLSPSQSRNLEEILKCRVMDRSELIIEIFSKHASSKQAQLQVELAKLKYIRPRLKRMWTHLDRNQGGIGSKGDGETQLETDKRLLKNRIYEITDRIQEIADRKEREIETRSDDFTVALVGYTNSGKSTVLKNLTGLDTYIADKLFATLDTTTRKVYLEKDLDIYLTDTVGFVRDLPHHLVASFKATLLEAKHSKLLLHIVEASSESPQNQVKAVNIVLNELNLIEMPQILVFNKLDLLTEETHQKLSAEFPEAIFISATENTNIDLLKNKIIELATASRNREKIKVHLGAGKVLAMIEANTKIIDKKYEGEFVNYLLEGKDSVIKQINNKLKEYETEMQK